MAVDAGVLHGRKCSLNVYMIRWFFKYGEPLDEDNTMARCVRCIWMDGDSSNESDVREFIR